MKNTKLSPMIFCAQLILLAFASVAIVGLLVEAETCTVGFSPCVPDCNAFCNKKNPGTTGACIKSQCVCSYECLPAKRCNDGLGPCSAVVIKNVKPNIPTLMLLVSGTIALALPVPCVNVNITAVRRNVSRLFKKKKQKKRRRRNVSRWNKNKC
ncbi:hypothetical protein ACLB2K_038219 [Fragaria x ananassa]